MTDIIKEEKELSPGQYLRQLRYQRDVTQKEIADYVGTSQVSVARWEREQIGISQKKALKLANFFGVSVDGFLKEKSPLRNGQSFKDFFQKIKVYDMESGRSVIDNDAMFRELPVNEGCFVVRIGDDSMTSHVTGQTLPRGSYAILRHVDDMENWEHRVIYGSVDNGKHYMVRELCNAGGKYFLKPWNSQYPSEFQMDNFNIVGVVVGYFVKLHI